ncbi:hypothetical protein K491DRAFT_683239 [Lophiostoma macrostomum CBS 122681]|uniref:GRF-type domain-containing protein n=1 Tax=Lophiostoma macrostomum CBS 122681 TaxID=1314788 RepID=A0A6A6SQN4_9PLEO|nr:hypothetical protein K491DRAFT_683239 [Lophiostoma macrostomum CBS 122681]
MNGVWHCDCNPRQPAVHFQTKKEGANQGRWFYSCQKQRDDPRSCKFFLWDSDAKPREQRALQSNSRTEPNRTNATPTRPQRDISPPPPYTVESGPSESVRKRNRALVDEDEDEDEDDYGFDREDTEFDNELNRAVVAAETPRKAARTESHTTPRRTLPWDTERNVAAGSLPTPQTDQRTKDPFSTRFSQPGGSFLTPSRFHDEDAQRQTVTPASSPFDTPTPARFKDVGTEKPDDIVQDVFGLLREEGVVLDTKPESSLRRLLEKHARRAEGANQGREVARRHMVAKDARITELTYKNNTLQAELEAEKATITMMVWERDKGSND